MSLQNVTSSKPMDIIAEFKKPCPCGHVHETAIRDIVVESGAVHKVGEILKKNGFPKTLYLVADQNTLKASAGILESLADFTLECWIFKDQRVPTMDQVNTIAARIRGRDIGVISIGTGSLNDICRVAAAREDKLFCIFGTAPSMDGFASYSAPIIDNSFKFSYPAKSPEVIIADTKILANAPVALKAAGFGDMIAKYVAIVDWKISALISGEYYCERVANLTLTAVNELMEMADKVTVNDEKTAGMIFEALLKTGLGMSFVKASRPASGGEHGIAHMMECFDIFEGKVPHYHGEDVGVCTLAALQYYREIAAHEKVHAHKENIDWADVFKTFGPLEPDIRKMNTPDTITDSVDPKKLEEAWPKIREIIAEMPPYDVCYDAMKKAGCKLTIEDIGVTPARYQMFRRYSPFMRRRLTLLRLMDMIDPA